MTEQTVEAARVPLIDYLVLDDEPYLRARRCTGCGATYFDRRNGCAACSGTDFTTIPVAREGNLVTYTIVSFAAPGVPVPFVAGVVDCDGIEVRGNVVGVEPVPENLTLGMGVRLATFVVGVDEAGTEAIGFGFEPVDSAESVKDKEQP